MDTEASNKNNLLITFDSIFNGAFHQYFSPQVIYGQTILGFITCQLYIYITGLQGRKISAEIFAISKLN